MTRHHSSVRLEVATTADDVKPEDMTPAQLRDDIWATLSSIESLYRVIVRHEAESGPVFVTAEGKRAQAEHHAEEVAAMKQRLKDGYAVGPGQSPAPGNVSEISVVAEVWHTLRSRAFELGKLIKQRDPEAEIGTPSDQNDVNALAWHLNVLIGHLDDEEDHKLLARTLRALQRVETGAERVVYGEQRQLLDANCPWCGNRTLVLYKRDGVVRCERDRVKAIPCVCSTELCDCHRAPVAFQHTWHRDRGAKADGLWGLVDQIARAQRLERRRTS